MGNEWLRKTKAQITHGRVLWAEYLCLPIHIFKLDPQSDVIRRWGLWKLIMPRGWSPMNGTSALIRDPRELARSTPTMRGYRRGWQSTTQKRALTRTQPRWHSDLGLPGSRTVTSTSLLCISHLIPATLLWQPMDRDAM